LFFVYAQYIFALEFIVVFSEFFPWNLGHDSLAISIFTVKRLGIGEKRGGKNIEINYGQQ
jgi:hypothetical protein